MTIKTFVLDNEKTIMEATVYVRSLSAANTPGTKRIEIHDSEPLDINKIEDFDSEQGW